MLHAVVKRSRPLMKRVRYEPWFYTCGMSYKRVPFVHWDSHALWYPNHRNVTVFYV